MWMYPLYPTAYGPDMYVWKRDNPLALERRKRAACWILIKSDMNISFFLFQFHALPNYHVACYALKSSKE